MNTFLPSWYQFYSMNNWHTLNVLNKHVKRTSENFLKIFWLKNSEGSDESENCLLIGIDKIIVSQILMKSISQLSKVRFVVRNFLALKNQSVCSHRIIFFRDQFLKESLSRILFDVP